MLSKIFSFASKAILAAVLTAVIGHYAITAAMIAKRLYLGISVADLLTFERVVEDKAFYPWVYWRRPAFSTETVNVDATGSRKTIKAPAPDALKLYMFGGSVVWGSGVADNETIPSLLQERLGNGYDIHNYGEKNYVSVQATNALLERLAKGDRPDIVIFINGYNDGLAGLYDPAIPRDPRLMREKYYADQDRANQGVFGLLLETLRRSNWQLLVNYLRWGDSRGDLRKFKAEREPALLPHVKSNAEKVVAYWLENCRQVAGIGMAYGFETYCIWQPNALNGQKTLTEEEQAKLKINGVTPGALEIFRTLYSVGRSTIPGREADNIYFFGDIFKDVEETVYTNHFKLNSRGNALIADEIHSLLTAARR